MAASTINRKLGCLELSRIKMLQGDFSGSSAVLGPLLDELFDETNEGPVLKKGEIAGNIMAGTFGDDNSIPYELPAFELLFGLQYQAVNQLSLGERDNARVYLRRATAVQLARGFACHRPRACGEVPHHRPAFSVLARMLGW